MSRAYGDHQEYWRSREQRDGDPSVRPFVEREFQEGASELPEGVSRRSLIQLVGASLSLAGLAACRRPVEHIVPFVRAPEDMLPGIPRLFATSMPTGLDAVGLLVTSHEGRPTKIEGNELHPASLGATSAWAQASILDLYDPDRSQHVLHQGQKASWQAFLDAWRALEPAHLADGGARLAVVTRPFASPTLARLIAALRARFPQARVVGYEPVGDELILRGLEAATGAPALPLLHPERARVVVAIDSDFLLTGTGSVAHARRFADGRRVAGSDGTMSRLWAIEAVHSLTGANADHRLPLRSDQIATFVAALGSRLGIETGLTLDAGPATFDSTWLEALAADLGAHRGASLLTAGRRQAPAVHAAVHALNQGLGNLGVTVEYARLADAVLPDTAAFATVLESMRAGEISTLLLLGANPLYDAPAGLDAAAALAAVETTIHLGAHADETGAATTWHLPEAHFLEAWGDTRALDGTIGVVQPLIAPLYEGRSAIELLAVIAGESAPPPTLPEGETADAAAPPPTPEPASGYDAVRATWRQILGTTESLALDGGWERVVHDGLLPAANTWAGIPPAAGTGAAAVPPASAGARSASDGALDLVLLDSPRVFDGRYANNAWLQELPDAITKVTWDNPAMLAPATAAELGLRNEDLVRIAAGDLEIEVPVWIVPGMAPRTVAVELGYGRAFGGRVADGVGANVYPLRSAGDPYLVAGVRVERRGNQREIAQTQDHGSMEGRPIVREATLEAYSAHPEFAREAVEVPHTRALWKEEWSYEQGYQWGMTIDLNACTGCNACVIACQAENNVPVVGRAEVRRGREMHWLRIDRYFAGDEAAPQTVFHPVPCMQCENAPCEQVCPVTATVHDAEGLNVMVYNRCIGTRYCLNNCPYKVRRFNYFNFTKHTPQVLRLQNNPDVTVRSRGVMEKCTYCTQRINERKIAAKLEERTLRDGEVKTACQQACPSQAIQFGNILDGASAVAQAKAEPRNYTLLDELLTKPRTSYLAKLRNPHQELAGAPKVETHAQAGSARATGEHGDDSA
jgi:MoCo/4Fe-4S cofactor protein with predicted Tat translocation signal